MSMPICECRWLIADRLRRPFYRRGLKIGDSIDIRSAAAKNNRRVEKVGAEMLCIKKPVRVLRLSRCRDRALRSTQANKTGKESSYPHRQIVWAPQQERYSPHSPSGRTFASFHCSGEPTPVRIKLRTRMSLKYRYNLQRLKEVRAGEGADSDAFRLTGRDSDLKPATIPI